jgi:hypothetical protein
MSLSEQALSQQLGATLPGLRRFLLLIFPEPLVIQGSFAEPRSPGRYGAAQNSS